jgi:hypothetical protein
VPRPLRGDDQQSRCKAEHEEDAEADGSTAKSTASKLNLCRHDL